MGEVLEISFVASSSVQKRDRGEEMSVAISGGDSPGSDGVDVERESGEASIKLTD